MATRDDHGGTMEVRQAVFTKISALSEQLSNFLSSHTRRHKGVIRTCYDYVNRIAEVAIESGYLSLYEFCALYQERLLSVDKKAPRITRDVRQALVLWPTIIADISSADDVVDRLIAHLDLPCWGMKVSDNDKALLKAAFTCNPDTLAKPPASIHDPTDAAVPSSVEEPVEMDTGVDGAAQTLPDSVLELVVILQEEFEEISVYLGTMISSAANADFDIDAQSTALKQYAGMLNNYGEAAASIGFGGLEAVCRHIRQNVIKMSEAGRHLTEREAQLLDKWAVCVKGYLGAVTDQGSASSLAMILADRGWPVALADDEMNSLRARLMRPEYSSELVNDEAQTALEVQPEDASIELPDDINQELLDALMQEFPDQAEELSAEIQALTESDDPNHISTAQRLAHTVKGAGNTVAIPGIANIAHRLEDILIALAKHEVLPSQALLESMIDATSCLESMGEALLGVGDPPDDALKVLQSIVDWIGRIERDGIAAAARDTKIATSAKTSTDTGKSDDQMQEMPKAVAEFQRSGGKDSKMSSNPILRIPKSLIESLTRMAGEGLILTGHCHERVYNIKSEKQKIEAHCLMLREISGELEELIDVKDMSGLLTPQTQQGSTYFDSMEMEQYGELHTNIRQLTEIAADISEMVNSFSQHLTHLEEFIIAQKKINRELHEVSLRTRMLPAKTIFSRLNRVVRQVSNSTSKQVALHAKGGETLISGDKLSHLVEPIMHILRNAVDHGIEDAATRAALGKSLEGNIEIDFRHQGEHIVICIRDDGAGLHYDRIRRAAEAQGMIEPGEEVSEKTLTELIMKLNFSTRSETTQISGRGIGMNAVGTSISQLGGKLHFESQPNQGCVVEMSIPVSLLSAHTLLVRCSSRLVVVTGKDIQQITSTEHGELIEEDDQLKFSLEHQNYHVESLASLLNIPDRRSLKNRRTATPIIVLNDPNNTNAVLVDVIIDSRERTIKNLGAHIPKVHGILGVTILGDGTVVPVVDLSELFGESAYAVEFYQDDRQAEISKPKVMVVDDSLSVRRSLTLLLEDSGYRVREARDGVEAVDILGGMKPDILLVDMEMPRMNGIELTLYVRNEESIADIPIVMITSRATKKHRDEAERAGVNSHLIKPVNEDILLEEIQRLRLARLN